MAHTKGSTRRPRVAARRYRRDPQRAGLARSFGAWATRQGVEVHALTAEQCIVLEAVRRFLAWSGPGTLFTRLAFLLLLHVGLRFPRRIVQAVLGRSITDKSVWRALTPGEAVTRLRAGDAQAPRMFAASARDYARLLREHMRIEDHYFQDVSSLLSPAEDDVLYRLGQFEAELQHLRDKRA